MIDEVMIKQLKYYLLVLIIGSILPCSAQETSVAIPIEDIVIQTDRDIYIPGETIWFKADYLVNGQLSGDILSNVIYVELLSLNGDIISQSKYENLDFMISGNIVITEGLSSGYYILRAYTQYQRNFRPENYAAKHLTLINPAIPLSGYDIEKDTTLEFALMHQENIEKTINEIAIRIDPRLSFDMKSAFIVNQYDDTIKKVVVAKNGLGSFNLAKNDTINYSLLLSLNGGKSYRQGIPETFNEENFLESKFDGNHLKVKFTIHSESGKETEHAFKLKVYSKAYNLISERNITTGSWHQLNIQKSGIHSGLNYIVLTDINDRVKSIKAVYLQTSKPINIEIQKNKQDYTQRESVELKLIKPSSANDEIDHLSVTVVKHKTIEKSKDLPQIIIENPHLLDDHIRFRDMDKKLLQQIDILLALYSQQRMNNKSFTNEYNQDQASSYWLPESRGVTISGKVKNKTTGEAIPGVDVYIATIGDHPQMHIFTTNLQGEFISTLKHVSGPQSVFLCIRNDEEENMEILVNNDYSKNLPGYRYSAVIPDTGAFNFIKSLYVNAQLSQQYNNVSTMPLITDTLRPIRFTKPNINIVLDDYIPMETLTDVINELVPYAKVRKSKDKHYLVLVDDKAQTTYDDPLVLLDNLPVFNINKLLKVNPKSIRQISVINSKMVYGDHLLKGIVMFESNTDNFGNIELPVSSTFLEFDAGNANEQYVGIDNSDEIKTSNRTPDFRNTLYWNPNIEFENDEATVSFLTSDDEGTYDVVVRGIATNGKILFSSTQFRVSK